MNANSLFIDTNVLVYANVLTAPLHEAALQALQEAHQARRPLWISRQVLREFIAVCTRLQPFARSSTLEMITARVKYLEEHFKVADDTAAVTKELL